MGRGPAGPPRPAGLPDLSRTNLKNLAVYGELPPAEQLFQSAIYTLSYTLIVLSITVVILGKKEF